jgi:uncharacterized protein (DUF2236 family)
VYHRLIWIGKDVTFMSNTWVIVLSVVAGVAVVGALMSIVTALVINRRHRRIDSLADLGTWLAAWLPAANVVMQLAHPAVGYGVYESPVKSGRADLHPVKRGRTTALYLAVATVGSEADKRFVHDEVKKIHAQVYSRESSPVRYSGNAIPLQRWVALCLVRYFVDQYEMVYGPMDTAHRDRAVVVGRTLATTLNVPAGSWPTTWTDYEDEFAKGLAEVRIDPPVRKYLNDLTTYKGLKVQLGSVGALIHRLYGPWALAITKHGVPQEVRDAMEWTITDADRRRFALLVFAARIGRWTVPFPLPIGYRLYLWDMRLRRRVGRPVF